MGNEFFRRDTKKCEMNGYRRDLTGEVIEYSSACLLTVMVATNGIIKGDSGHGGVTYLKIENNGGADMQVCVTDKRNKKEERFLEPDSIQLVFGGECETRIILDALEQAARILKEQIAANEELY